MTYSSPSRTARVRSDARSEPASGSLKPWHQRSRPLIERRQEAIADLLAPVTGDALDQVAEAGLGRRARRRELLVDDDLVDRWQLLPAVGLGPASSPKNPASNSAQCHSACCAQYSSSVDDAGRPGLWSTSQSRKRARNSASWGESSKSIAGSLSSPRRPFAARRTRRWCPSSPTTRSTSSRAAQVHVHEAFPRVADPAVHLDRGLADGASRVGAVRLGDRSRPPTRRPAARRRRPTTRTAPR